MGRPKRTATTYLQVVPSRYMEAKVVKATQKKPDQLAPGAVVVKVQLSLPSEAWDPFEPEAVIDVPAELIQHPISVEAVDAND